MKRMSVLILALLLLFSACSAEIVKDLPPEEIQPSASEAVVEVVSGNSISVSFSPVPYARGYGYQLSDGNGYHDIASSELHFSNGLISFTISDVSQMAGDVFVYAVDGSTGNTVQIASASYTLSLENIAPDVYISERGEDFVELRTSTDNAESFFYKVNIKENGISDDDPGTDYFFFNTLCSPLWMTREANGLFLRIYKIMIARAVVSISASVLLSVAIGLPGIFLGSLIGLVTTNMWYEPRMLCNEVFFCKFSEFVKVFLLAVLKAFIVFGLSILLFSNLGETIFWMIVKCMLVGVLCLIVYSRDILSVLRRTY